MQNPIRGIGIDVLAHERLKRLLDSGGRERLGRRLLSESEQDAWSRNEWDAGWLARCLAAKEAFFKASGNEWLGPDGFREIEIRFSGPDRFEVCQGGLIRGEGACFGNERWAGAQVLCWNED